MNIVIVSLLWGIFCGLIGAAVGAMKGKWAQGMLLGALLGPVGIIIAALILKRDYPYSSSGSHYYGHNKQEKPKLPFPHHKKKKEKEIEANYEIKDEQKEIVPPKRKKPLYRRHKL